MRPAAGEFAQIRGSDFGIGKIAAVERSFAVVSYFDSPAVGEVHRETVPLSKVEMVRLSAQTRVYWFHEEKRAWLVGRVAIDGRVEGRLLGHDEDLYFILLPNKESERVPISKLHVRWNRRVSDPVDYLSARTTETPYWHAGRRSFLRSLAREREYSGGITGLWSSSVRLEFHQLETVRTVLADPIQRYLLADEVGLGKTIEAGAILRQYVLDEPATHKALVLVPPHLEQQWRQELQDRFYLGALLDESVIVQTVDEDLRLQDLGHDFGMLIVDEAHQPAGMAFDADPIRRERYRALAALAANVPRLLLLSATPVLRNEAGFLAMLHLLEPTGYPLDDLEGFRLRLAHRQDIAEALNDLQSDAMALFLEDALDRMEPLLSADPKGLELVADLRGRLDDDEHDDARQKAIRELRTHISEVYRLHRRLIRHRRDTVSDILRAREGATVLSCSDPDRAYLGDLLELWRQHANLSVQRSELRRASDLFGAMLDALLVHPMALRATVTAWLEGGEVASGFRIEGATTLPVASRGEFFHGDHDLLRQMLARGYEEEWPRVMQVVELVRTPTPKLTKTLIFASLPGVADTLADRLQLHLGDAVLRYSVGADLDDFVDPEGPVTVLVCDYAAEEGLNLQSARARVVHFDLPLDPRRIEQRLGRVDRYGARAGAKSVVFRDEFAIAAAWCACLMDDIQVFSRSIASLQYVLEDELRITREALFSDGVEALENLSSRLGHESQGLEPELRRIRTQEQLDAIEEAGETDRGAFEELDEFDAEDEEFQTGFEEWAVSRLGFRTVVEERQPGTARYAYTLSHTRPTLIQPEQFIAYCAGSVDASLGESSRTSGLLAFSRSQARRRGAQLMRLGHPLIDGLAEHALRDDRGVAFAMWRQCRDFSPPHGDYTLAFGFDYLIEADASVAAQVLKRDDRVGHAALRRYLDAVFPPRYETVWIDSDLQLIQDPALLAALTAPYEKAREGRNGDWHLSTERWAVLEQAVAVGDWAGLCRAAASAAARHARALTNTDERAAVAIGRIEARLERSRVQMQARLSRLRGRIRQLEQDALATEEQLAAASLDAVRSPTMRPDSAFAVFVSAYTPFLRGRE